MVRTTAILTVGLLIGGGVVQVLHAQAKPPGYLIGEIAVTVDEAAYKDSEFMKQTMPSIQASGAKYIAGAFNKAVALSGAPVANRYVALQFDSVDKAKEWYSNGQAEREKTLGSKDASSFRILLVDGVNQ